MGTKMMGSEHDNDASESETRAEGVKKGQTKRFAQSLGNQDEREQHATLHRNLVLALMVPIFFIRL